VKDLHELFVAEARELIAQATDDLIALEREQQAPERVERIFRAFHTLKGTAGLVELPAMSVAVHAAEDVLAAVHAGRLSPDRDIINGALACLDQVGRWVDEVESRGELPARSGDDARSIAGQLRALLPSSDVGTPLRHAAPDTLPEWVHHLIADRRLEATRAPPLWAIAYEPHAQCFFTGDDPLGLLRRVPGLLALRIEPRNPWPPLAELDPYACNLRVLALCAADREEIAHIFRLVPDQVRIIDVPAAALEVPRAGADEGVAAADLVRAVVEEQREVLRIASGTASFVGCAGAAARAAANALRCSGHVELAKRVERAGAASRSQQDAEPLLSELGDALRSLAAGPVSSDLLDGASAPAPAGMFSPQGNHDGAPASRVLRVDEGRLDALVNLAGELIVAKNGLLNLVRRLEVELGGGHELSGVARREHETIDRLSSELYRATLQLRMVGVAQAFRSLPRLVRDLSHQLGKNVDLVTVGEATEADKTVVDRLFEPLVHLVRNALDHGIESPEQRRAAGKPERATLSVRASQHGDRVAIEVGDDGRGIDPALVRSKALAAATAGPDELAALSDDQVLELVFAPGFSTAADVSDISGRGIGMGAVRIAIEQIGGRVSLTSRVGSGTRVCLDLPLTIAISRIMVVESGGNLFGIPMEMVVETLRLAPDKISRIKGNEGFLLRERVVPISSLAGLMQLPERARQAAEARLLIVVGINGKIAAIEVDAIRGRLDVVLKPMRGVLAGARGYGGTTLLPDGRVLLVLDLTEILA
jgi:two-component system chemotaxis sensor kinase CheA